MNGRFLLDTNAVIGVFAGDTGVLSIVSPAAECFLSSIVLGELFYGAQLSSKGDDNIKKIQAFCDTVTVLSCDQETAAEYSRIKSQLRDTGKPIPENDVWIAAIAAQYQLPLLSRDQHFDEVNGLNRVSW